MSPSQLSQLWPRNAFRFGGGGSPAPQQQIAPAPVPSPSPPVEPNDPSVVAAEQDVAQQNLLKKSVKKTILAGDTGGFSPSSAGAGKPDFNVSYKGKLG